MREKSARDLRAPRPYVIVLSLVLAAIPAISPHAVFSQQQEPLVMQNQADYYYREGKNQVAGGDLDRALTSFQKALSLDPGLIKAYNEAGIILTINGEVEQAQEMFLRAIAADPRYPDPYSNLGLLYEEEGDYGSALVCWKNRAGLGGGDDPWAEVARKRIQEIAQAYPGIYNAVQEGKYALEVGRFAPVSGSRERSQAAPPVQYDQPQKVSLFREDTLSPRERTDKRASALDYLARARDFYSRGEFVGALREATIAEYLDPANPDIVSFIQQIREAILQ